MGVLIREDRISSLGGDRGASVDDTMLGADGTSLLLSGSSGIASLDSGRAVLMEGLAGSRVGDFTSFTLGGFGFELVNIGCLRGLVGVVAVREAAEEGRLGGTEVVEAADAASSLPLAAGLRAEDVTGRVGGLLIVLPFVRDANALVRVDVGDASGLVFVVSLVEEAAVGFLASSVLAGGFAPAAVLLSIIRVL